MTSTLAGYRPCVNLGTLTRLYHAQGPRLRTEAMEGLVDVSGNGETTL
jgi:hypothetical protein